LFFVVEGNRAYIPVLYVFNKIDAITIEELDILDQMPNYVPISSQHMWNLEELMEEIWNRCNMIRIYTKPKGKEVIDLIMSVELTRKKTDYNDCSNQAKYRIMMPLSFCIQKIPV
jgi:ribosome-interacting GTPase 1